MSANAELLARMPRGLLDPTHDAQAVFRSVLNVLSRPGQRETLAVADGLQAPAPWSRGLSALLLTLLDAETSLHLGDAASSEAAWAYARFHTGVQQAARSQAAFVVDRADQASWQAVQLGSDTAPQDGATLIVEATSLAGQELVLQGPGIQHTQRLGLCGLSRDFWQQRIALQSQFPCGVDLLIVCGTQLVGVPRSTRITMEGV